MEKQFVTYEIALDLKKLGFKDKCMASYYTYDIENFKKGEYDMRGKFECDYSTEDQYIINTDKTYYVAAPLWQQVIDWFRDIKKIDIEITRVFIDHKISYTIYIRNIIGITLFTTWYQITEENVIYTFQDARKLAIEKAIVNITK